jgi:hypothetical protein
VPCTRVETFARADDRPIELVIYRLDGSMGFEAALRALSVVLGPAHRRDAKPARSAEWRPGPWLTPPPRAAEPIAPASGFAADRALLPSSALPAVASALPTSSEEPTAPLVGAGPTVTLTSDGAIYVAADVRLLAAPFRDALVAPYPWPTVTTRLDVAASAVGLGDDDEVALGRPGWRRAPVPAPPGCVDVLGSYDDVPVVVIGAYARPLPTRVVTHTVGLPNRGPGYHALRLDDDRTSTLRARTLDAVVTHLQALGCDVRSEVVDDD